MMSLLTVLKFHNNVHSYSQLIMLPWGYSSNLQDLPDNIVAMTRVAEAGNRALFAVNGSRYEVGYGCSMCCI